MPKKAMPQISADVAVFRVLLVAFITLYGSFAVINFAVVSVTAVGAFLIKHNRFSIFWDQIGVFFNFVLTGLMYFLIGREIYKLIALINRGETFSSDSPRRIRKIAFLIFGLALSGAIGTAIQVSTPPGEMVSVIIFRVIFGGFGTVLLGFGFLVIAKVIESGVTLQQDQSLTI